MYLEHVAERIVDTLSNRPAALFSDFDGVLAEIASTPDGACAHPDAERAIASIAARVDVAGIISGRAVDDVGTKLPIDDLIVVGNHGLEWWNKGERHDHEAGLAAIDGVKHVLASVRAQMQTHPDFDKIIWEDKRLSGSIHFRNALDPVEMEAVLAPIVQQFADDNGLRCTFGKMVIELRPKATVTKGTALAELARIHGLASVVFIGDDVTDIDGFKTLIELREQDIHTLAVGVVAPDAHPDLVKYADVTVNSVDEIVTVLLRVGELL